mmetsp:Transcript_2669/g.5594  ORF Transcript_2669/g.5594 Transcript_2669/m.5594 type:complete len:200 (+) Transcript_2669:1479-2078(+)
MARHAGRRPPRPPPRPPPVAPPHPMRNQKNIMTFSAWVVSAIRSPTSTWRCPGVRPMRTCPISSPQAFWMIISSTTTLPPPWTFSSRSSLAYWAVTPTRRSSCRRCSCSRCRPRLGACSGRWQCRRTRSCGPSCTTRETRSRRLVAVGRPASTGGSCASRLQSPLRTKRDRSSSRSVGCGTSSHVPRRPSRSARRSSSD